MSLVRLYVTFGSTARWLSWRYSYGDGVVGIEVGGIDNSAHEPSHLLSQRETFDPRGGRAAGILPPIAKSTTLFTASDSCKSAQKTSARIML